MRAFVFGGGEIFPEYIEERVQDGDIVVCADSGYKNALSMGVKVDVLVGDFDSLGSVPDGDFELVRVPAEKNSTDTQLAVDIAIERGADEMIIVSSTSGRVDHALSAMAILEYLWTKRIPAVVVNGQNRVRFIRDSGAIIIRSQYKYFSVVTLDAVAKKVSIDGAKYPLVKKDIERGFQFAVSNEIVKNAALITVKKGSVYIIESRDV
ncbi:MAG: thiamine diphosphokinase [Ruminococcaceae bacterium]|nr:thiamine diphosphokinase [Oscillospiraceae bacterium]